MIWTCMLSRLQSFCFRFAVIDLYCISHPGVAVLISPYLIVCTCTFLLMFAVPVSCLQPKKLFMPDDGHLQQTYQTVIAKCLTHVKKHNKTSLNELFNMQFSCLCEFNICFF